jgi:hypothetical protein
MKAIIAPGDVKGGKQAISQQCAQAVTTPVTVLTILVGTLRQSCVAAVFP